MELVTLGAVVAVALFFDFTNGFHDTANSIATSVSTRAVSPRTAVVMAAILNFVGAFASFEVAATVAKGIVVPDVITLDVLLAGLVGAITWNLITWYFGLPSSSSHALIGGVLGSAIAAAGLDVGLVKPIRTEEMQPPRPAARPPYAVLDNAALRLSGLPLLPERHDALARLVPDLLPAAVGR